MQLILSLLFDTVLVQTGIYYENISLISKNVTVASNYIFTSDTLDIINTILDGVNSGPVVDMANVASTSNLIGMSIRGSNTTAYPAIHVSNGRIESNLFEHNNEGSILGGSNIEIISNTFRFNDSTIVIELFTDQNTAQIVDNIFYQNSYSVILFTDSPGLLFDNNQIYDNIGIIFDCWMIGYGNWGQAIFRGNLIYGNHCPWGMAGGIFHAEDSNILSENNIICNNTGVPGSYLSVFYEEHSTNCPVIFNNNIIWGNVYYEDSLISISYVNFTMDYSDIQGGWSGLGNIDIDPLFRDPDNGDFHLMSTACGDPYDSPLIDMGDPNILDSLLDCYWGLGTALSDMGAYGGGDSVMVGIPGELLNTPTELTLSQNYPNPFNPTTTISFSLPEPSDISLTIYNILGQQVATPFEGAKQAGEHTINWNATDFPSGVYFARLETEKRSKNIKMLLIK